MSTFKVEVVQVVIEAHPNADKLEVARVRGWTCVTGKGQFKTGDLAVYIPVDSVLPDALVAELRIKNYRNRLRAVKLRGIVSQGMVMPALAGDVEGADVTARLGITKYEEPIPVHMAGLARPADDRFVRYTDIENYKNFPGVFDSVDEVIVTEKLHGSNLRIANIDGDVHVGSHRLDLVENSQNLYWRAATMIEAPKRLKPGEQVFGEVYGKGVQDLTYGRAGISVAIFDVMVGSRFLDYDDFCKFLDERGWSHIQAPRVYRGTTYGVDFQSLAAGKSVVCPEQMREGVVVRPTRETYSDILFGRMIAKCISDEYATRKDGTERH